ncbi:hypothetical protein RMN57_13140 [Kitasatospora sp. CM 4170]|uniref:Uncharacterized protein n=1 Tax=Kitasatospora aburaviensis TaxID=67265 RepID=A0ABW1F3I4_9ACTN|nr:hypothetical protein [Kitasatospora sp. CM 4170]WNM45599.1 hypothetical protein RMN57_13140 [Kitasatospora sp. CM 4170]
MTIQRRAAGRLYDGSAEVARRLGRRAADANLWVKLGGGLVLWKGAPGLLDAAHQQPLLPVAAAGAWCWAAWRAGKPPDTATETSAEDAPEAAGDSPETGEEPAAKPEQAAEFLTMLHRLMPHPGDRIHLAQVAAEMSGDPTATGPVRDLCAAAGVTVTAVRVKGRGSSTGIYRRDLPPLPAPSPGPLSGVVVAGQHGQQQHQQHSEKGPEKGFVTTADPANPARSIIHWENAS